LYEKSRFFRHLDDSRHLLADGIVILPPVGPQAIGAVLDAAFRIAEIAAALVPQSIQGAVAKQATESFWIRTGMAGKILTFPVLEKVIMGHCVPPLALV